MQSLCGPCRQRGYGVSIAADLVQPCRQCHVDVFDGFSYCETCAAWGERCAWCGQKTQRRDDDFCDTCRQHGLGMSATINLERRCLGCDSGVGWGLRLCPPCARQRGQCAWCASDRQKNLVPSHQQPGWRPNFLPSLERWLTNLAPPRRPPRRHLPSRRRHCHRRHRVRPHPLLLRAPTSERGVAS